MAKPEKPTDEETIARADRAMQLDCSGGCGRVISIHPPHMPRKVERVLPMAISAVGGFDLGGWQGGKAISGEPTLFGLNAAEVAFLLAPRCAECTRAFERENRALFPLAEIPALASGV